MPAQEKLVRNAPVSVPLLSMIRYTPRFNAESRMVGGQFQGSADGVTYTTLYTIQKAPVAGRWNIAAVTQDLRTFRFLRYLAPPHSYGNIAELEFDDTQGVKLAGTGFGTPGSRLSQGNTYAKALDGQFASYFDAPDPGSGDFVGIDRSAPPPPAPAPPAPVSLPIEIMGTDGTTQSVQVSVAAPATVTGLWMQAHNLSYADKASVRVNSGPWMPLDNDTVQVSEPGKSYGGIGGGFSTLKMLLPLPAGSLVAGTNTLSFRFNQTDGVSSGFRILAFNLMTAAGQPVLPVSTFVQDNPNTWQPPMTDAGSIAAGQALYQSGQLLESSVVHLPIRAACADCHTDDGRDLKYFNYSNYSIVERSEFHGMTQTQGQQIASYIRTLNVPNPGRPWNPPYQPGPGLDSQPVQNWAAGAGVDAVLDKDSDMLPYLFPNGVSDPVVTKTAVATSATLNMRELPIALQLLDWNHWLPRVHPKDAWGDAFNNAPVNTFYPTLKTALTMSNGQANMSSVSDNPLSYWLSRTSQFIEPRYAGTQTPSGPILSTPSYSEAIYSVALWQRVKVWGIMQQFSLEDKEQVFRGPQTEARSWYDSGAFLASPAMLRIPGDETGLIEGGTEPINGTGYEYLNNSWYYLQVILNAGNRQRGSWNPVDWGYIRPRVNSLAAYSHVPEAMRLTALYVKGMQQGDNGVGPSANFGWDPRFLGDLSILVDQSYAPTISEFDAIDAGEKPGYGPNTKVQIFGALLGNWLDLSRRYSPQQYYSAGLASPSELPDGNYNGGSLLSKFHDGVLPLMRAEGVDGDLLDSASVWGQTVWPLADWNAPHHH